MAEQITLEEKRLVDQEVQLLEMGEKINKQSSEFDEFKKKYAQMESENAELKKQNDELSTESRTYAEQLAEQQEAARLEGNAEWLKSVENRLLPIEKEFAAYMLDVLTLAPGSEVRAYAMEVEENGKPAIAELAPVEVFMAMIESRDPEGLQHLYTEMSKGGGTEGGGEPSQRAQGGSKTYDDPKREAISRAKEMVKTFRKEGQDLPLSKAYGMVLEADTQLKEACAGIRPEGEAKADEGKQQMGRLYKR